MNATAHRHAAPTPVYDQSGRRVGTIFPVEGGLYIWGPRNTPCPAAKPTSYANAQEILRAIPFFGLTSVIDDTRTPISGNPLISSDE